MTTMEHDNDAIMANAPATSNDGLIPEMANRHKQEASRLVASRDYDGASQRYLAALRCIPSPPLWPRHEEFILTLHSNLALCFLKLHQSEIALEHTASARGLPIFDGKTSDELRRKILARHVEALLMMKERGEELPEESVGDSSLWSTLDEAQRRGYLTNGELRVNFLRYGGRTIAAPDGDEEAVTTTTKRALQAWTDHLVRNGTCTAIQAVQARQQYEKQTSRRNDASHTFTEKQMAISAVKAIQSILPVPEHSMGDVCKYVMGFIREGDSDRAVQILRKMLKRENGLYASEVDGDGTGYLMWAICFGLLVSNDKGEGPTRAFCAVLKVLVEEYGVHVDQRGQADGRNPLQYVTQSGRPEAVRAMLNHGANVNLRDEEGWTALHAICMNSVEDYGGGPSTTDRVETARLLIEAGADLEATSYLGMTPLLTLCTKPVLPLFELLLSKGSNLEHRSKNGWSAAYLIARAELDQGTRTKYTKLLERGGNFDADMKMLKFTKLMDEILVPVNNSCNGRRQSPLEELVRSPEARRDRAEQERANLRALLKYVDMNPDLLTTPFRKREPVNWLAEFHGRVNDLVPEAFQKVYFQEVPNNEELGLMMANNGQVLPSAEFEDSSSRRFDEEVAARLLLGPFRDRGNVLSRGHMESYHQMVLDPIQHCVGFAVPSDVLLDRIASYGQVIEVGAGTGYWSAALQSKGVDSVAFDVTPPNSEHDGNNFFDTTFTHVEQGDATTPSFWKKSCRSCRTLLIVWPNNPDEVDNAHLYKGEDLPPVWDADCLGEYLKAGGKTVVFVGEREENIQVLPGCPPDCGVSAGRRFQKILKEKFDMVECHKIPTWFLCEDDATIWVRKSE